LINYLSIEVEVTADTRKTHIFVELTAVHFCTSENASTTMTLAMSIKLAAATITTAARNRTVTVFKIAETVLVVLASRKKFTVIDRTTTIVTEDPVVSHDFGAAIVVVTIADIRNEIPLSAHGRAAPPVTVGGLEEIKNILRAVKKASATILVNGSDRKDVDHIILLRLNTLKEIVAHVVHCLFLTFLL
jgi:hypothetical protein